ncbi:hypothetical protein DL96DRAFT_1470608, partial [Flagelloscypha sp. PMI_526]
IQCTLLEALLATLSDAQVLPPVPIGETVLEYFVATTTGRCNPTGALLKELPTLFEAREISVIVSIGSGRPVPAAVTGQEDYLQAVLNLAKSCHEVSQNMESRFCRHPGLFVRLDVDEYDISNALQPGHVISHSRSYLDRADVQTLLNDLIHSLVQRPRRLKTRDISGLQVRSVNNLFNPHRNIQ